MQASAKIADISSMFTGDPVFLAGSLVAEEAYGLSNAHSDVDLFMPTDQVLVAMVQKALGLGFTLDDRFSRVWERWLRYGFKRWHTNSIRLTSPHGFEINMVYKLTDGHPTTSLSQVLESFDFGLLGVGYELETGSRRDLRPYLFPNHDVNGPLPLMPAKRDNWRNGFISQYNGLRECGRYAKYHTYGYDMTAVKDDLVTGYMEASTYLAGHFNPEKQQLGTIYGAIAVKIEDDEIDELLLASKKIDYQDSLDVIMEALE